MPRMERGGRAIFRRIKRKRNPGLFQGQTAHKRVPGFLFLRCAFFPCAVAVSYTHLLAWQKLMPGRPLFCSMTACGWPAQLWGKGSLERLVLWSVTHWALHLSLIHI